MVGGGMGGADFEAVGLATEPLSLEAAWIQADFTEHTQANQQVY